MFDLPGVMAALGVTGVKKVVLTVLAHPDDAEILCGGTLVRLAKAGWEVHIATMTAGVGTMEKIVGDRRDSDGGSEEGGKVHWRDLSLHG